MIGRRDFVRMCGGAALCTWSPQAVAQRKHAPARIGYLSAAGYLTAPTGPDQNVDALRDGFLQLGLRDGKDYVIVTRYSGEDYRLFPDLVGELLAEKVEIILAAGPASGIAKMSNLPVPVVFSFSGDPVDAGFVASMAHPGGSATGVSLLALELAAKRVEMLKEAVPSARLMAILANPKHPGEKSELRATREAAQSAALATRYYEVQSVNEFGAAFAAIEHDGCDCMVSFPEVLTVYNRKLLTDLALRQKIPSMFGWKMFAEAGGLMSYGPNIHDAYAHLAVFIDKILKGIHPADIPVEQPTRLELAINLKTAKALNITVPPTLLTRADVVIE